MLLARESVNSGLLFDLAKLDAEIADLTQKSEAADFWNNRNSALEIISHLNHSREIVDTYRALLRGQKDLEELLEFEDDSFLEQIEKSLEELNKQSKEFELQILFTGEFDSLNAIIEIHPGAGGTEAQQVEQKPKTGRICFIECTCYMQKRIALKCPFFLLNLEMKRVLSL